MGQQRKLSELMDLLGANTQEEIAPIKRHVFARKLGQIISRALTHVEARLSASPQSKRKRRAERE
jgi:hypothetical protein